MAVAEAIADLSKLNQLDQINSRINIIKDNIEGEMVVIMRKQLQLFERFFEQQEFEALERTDPVDTDGDGTPERTPEEKKDGGLAEFFKQLSAALIRFVGITLPAIIAALGLSNLGFTGLELKALDKVKAFFNGEWWKAKIDNLAKAFRENKAVVAIREFFEGGKIQAFFSNAFGKLRAFFSLEGEGLIAKTFQAIKGFGAKFMAIFGKIFYPISLLMSAFDGLQVGTKEFEETGGNFVSGFIGFVGGFLASFFGTFIDLIKDGLSWLLEKMFGEDNFVSEFLDSFSITDFMLEATSWISKAIDDLWEGVKSFFANFSFMDIVNYLRGGDEDDEGPTTRARVRAEQLAKQSQEVEGDEKMVAKREALAEEAATASASGAGTAVVQVNAPQTTNVSSSGTTLVSGTSPSSTNPGSARKRRRGGG